MEIRDSLTAFLFDEAAACYVGLVESGKEPDYEGLERRKNKEAGIKPEQKHYSSFKELYKDIQS